LPCDLLSCTCSTCKWMHSAVICSHFHQHHYPWRGKAYPLSSLSASNNIGRHHHQYRYSFGGVGYKPKVLPALATTGNVTIPQTSTTKLYSLEWLCSASTTGFYWRHKQQAQSTPLKLVPW
jgi:hypothetical protein